MEYNFYPLWENATRIKLLFRQQQKTYTKQALLVTDSLFVSRTIETFSDYIPEIFRVPKCSDYKPTLIERIAEPITITYSR